jgi:hypothetical protein
MSDTVHGSDVIIYKKYSEVWRAIACAISCSFNFTNEFIGKTDRNAGLFRKRRARISDVSGTVQGVTRLTNSDDTLSIFHFLEEGVRRSEGEYKYTFTAMDGTDKVVTMDGIVGVINISNDIESFSEYDMSILGTGGFVMDPLEPPSTDENITSDWWDTVAGESSISGLSSLKLESLIGKTIIEVDREGTQHDETTGTPGNREYLFNDITGTVSFDTTNPFNSGERIFVVWKD